jgi:processive 1,2-diacylglycerol beta-glucosyltransferase
MKRINIFYISDVGGHTKAARNLKEAFYYRDGDVRVLTINGFGHFYPRSEKIVDYIYTKVITHVPDVWGKSYDRKDLIKTLTPIRRWVSMLTARKLSRLVRDFNPDCFMATQAFPCGMLGDFKEQYGLSTPLISVVTDYHPHRFWIHPQVDRYVVACNEARETLEREGVPAEKIKVMGIPISIKFSNVMAREEVARRYGFSSKIPSVLIMGGSLGIGSMKDIAQKLDHVDCDFQTIVICGANEELHDWFDKNKANFKKPLFHFGYVDFVHEIMDFCDIIVTKGGGITLSESLAKGLAIIVVNAIPGQEERNVEYLTRMGAIIAPKDAHSVVSEVEQLLTNPKKMYTLKERAKENSAVDSSLRIVDMVLGEIA